MDLVVVVLIVLIVVFFFGGWKVTGPPSVPTGSRREGLALADVFWVLAVIAIIVLVVYLIRAV